MVQKIKTDVDRLLLISELTKNRSSKERRHFSFVSNIIYRNFGDKQNIAFPLLVDILTSTSQTLRKLLSIVF